MEPPVWPPAPRKPQRPAAPVRSGPGQQQRQLGAIQQQRPLSPARPRAQQATERSEQGQSNGSGEQLCLPGGSLGGIMYGGGLPGDAGQLFGPNAALVDLPWRGSAGEAHPMASVGAAVTVNGVLYTMDEHEALLIFHSVVRDLDVDPHWCPEPEPEADGADAGAAGSGANGSEANGSGLNGNGNGTNGNCANGSGVNGSGVNRRDEPKTGVGPKHAQGQPVTTGR